MHALKISILLLAAAPLLYSGEPDGEKEPPRIRPPEHSDDWLEAIERLRSMPRPGEIKNAGVSASIADVYELTPEQKAKVAGINAAFEAELLARAAKWDAEQRALRDDYEARVLLAIPQERRESAKKLLDFSHSKWITPLDRESAFKKEYLRRANELLEDRAKLSVEELNEKRKEMQAWVKAERHRINAQDAEVLKGLRALLSKDELERLEQFDRNRRQ